jgi:hypothetical protein
VCYCGLLKGVWGSEAGVARDLGVGLRRPLGEVVEPCVGVVEGLCQRCVGRRLCYRAAPQTRSPGLEARPGPHESGSGASPATEDAQSALFQSEVCLTPCQVADGGVQEAGDGFAEVVVVLVEGVED